MLNTYNPLESLNKFIFFPLGLFFAAIGIIIIIFAIHIMFKNKKLKKHGIITTFKVKDVKKIDKTSKDYTKGFRYYTVFEYTYNNVKKEDIIPTEKQFKSESEIEGLYLPLKNNEHIISVDGEGFHSSKGSEIIFISFGAFIIFAASQIIFNFPAIILGIVFISYLAILVIIFIIIPNLFSKRNKKYKTKKEKIYYDVSEIEETSSVTKTLVRYIPKNNSVKHTKKISWFLVALPIVLGGIGVYLGIMPIIAKYTYPTTTGEIVRIENYKHKENDSVIPAYIYKYIVDNQYYELENRVTNNSNYKIGDQGKIYYKKSDPHVAMLESNAKGTISSTVIGLLFIYIGIFIYRDQKLKVQLYKEYIAKGEK